MISKSCMYMREHEHSHYTLEDFQQKDIILRIKENIKDNY